MITADFSQGKTEIKIPALTQWDKNQKLSITGLENADSVFQVHFCNAGSKQAIVRIAYKNGDIHEVDIPNKLLKDKLAIFAYVYMTEYEQAAEVNELTEGSYYTKDGDVYTKVILPREFVGGTTYYKQKGTTVKTIIIPVIARKKPDDYIDAVDPSSEELIDELLRYCNNLNHRLDYYSKLVAEYRSQKWVYTMTAEEYEALVAAGKVENNVLYGIEDQELFDEIAQGIEDGDITVAKAEYATNAGRATRINGVHIGYSNNRLILEENSLKKIPYKIQLFNKDGFTTSSSEEVVLWESDRSLKNRKFEIEIWDKSYIFNTYGDWTWTRLIETIVWQGDTFYLLLIDLNYEDDKKLKISYTDTKNGDMLRETTFSICRLYEIIE